MLTLPGRSVVRLLVAAALSSTAWGDPGSAEVKILAQPPLPAHLTMPLDLRWADTNHVYLSTLRTGVLRFSLSDRAAHSVLAPAKLTVAQRQLLPTSLAASGERIAVGGSSPGFVWLDIERELHRQSFGSIRDIDMRGGKLAILGMRLSGRDWASEGAIAWIGTLSDGRAALTPLTTVSRERIPAYMKCAGLDLGAIRFLDAGQIVIAPEPERELQLFGSDGRRLRRWSGADIHFDPCRVTSQQESILVRIDSREAWTNQHRVLDDLIPLPGGFGAIVRRWENNLVRWTLYRYKLDGSPVQQIPIPVRSPLRFARMKADARGNRLALLIVDYGASRNSQPIARPLTIAELRER